MMYERVFYEDFYNFIDNYNLPLDNYWMKVCEPAKLVYENTQTGIVAYCYFDNKDKGELKFFITRGNHA